MKTRLLVPFLFLLSGCAMLGMGPSAPQNVSEAIGAAEATIVTVAHDVHDAKVSGAITQAEADKFKDQLQAAQNNIVLAIDAYSAGDLATVDGRLQATHTVLQSIIQALRDKGVKSHG